MDREDRARLKFVLNLYETLHEEISDIRYNGADAPYTFNDVPEDLVKAMDQSADLIRTLEKLIKL